MVVHNNFLSSEAVILNRDEEQAAGGKEKAAVEGCLFVPSSRALYCAGFLRGAGFLAPGGAFAVRMAPSFIVIMKGFGS